jgi:hypothetical protein
LPEVDRLGWDPASFHLARRGGGIAVCTRVLDFAARFVPIALASGLRLGTIRRVMVSLANAAVNRARKKNPKTKANTGTFQSRFKSAKGGLERLHARISAKFPNVLDLGD